MKKIIYLAIITLFFAACNTGQDSVKIDFDTERFFSTIAKTENCLQEGETFDKLGARMDAVIKAPIDTVRSATTLNYLYYEAHKRRQAAGEAQERCVDTYYATKARTLEKLSTLGTDEAMDFFLMIYKDTTLEFTQNENRSMIRFMENFGPSLLSKLEPIKNLRPQVGPVVVNKLKSQNQ